MVVKTHCKRGHEFTEENTYVAKNGARHCRECRKERMQKRRKGTQVGYANARKTKCAQGHPYDEENTMHYIGSSGRPRRGCKACAKVNATNQRLKKYGLTISEYAQLLAAQNNRCAICYQEFGPKPHIDHNHDTGKVRGILCFGCNSGLGVFKDNPVFLQNAIDYLLSFSETEPQ